MASTEDLAVAEGRGCVSRYGTAMDGTRQVAVHLENVRVRFEPKHKSDNDEALSLALDYHHNNDRRDALVFQAVARLRGAESDLSRAQEAIGRLRAALPPDPPVRFFGPCCVRFDPAGNGIWLMNKRETGWSSSGFLYASWDEVFRRFDAHVTSHGTDEAGEYWILSNREQAKEVSP